MPRSNAFMRVHSRARFKFKFNHFIINIYMYIIDIGPWGDKLEKLGLDKDTIKNFTLQYKDNYDGKDTIIQQ